MGEFFGIKAPEKKVSSLDVLILLVHHPCSVIKHLLNFKVVCFPQF
jgi:hypothetical protein